MVKSTNKFNTEKTRSMFLCTFLGTLGIHEFYQKKYLKGCLFLLFCILGFIGTMAKIPELVICLPIAIIASFISQTRLILNKKNSDTEFILGIIFILLQIIFISFKPTFYSKEKTITKTTENSKTTEHYSTKI